MKNYYLKDNDRERIRANCSRMVYIAQSLMSLTYKDVPMDDDAAKFIQSLIDINDKLDWKTPKALFDDLGSGSMLEMRELEIDESDIPF